MESLIFNQEYLQECFQYLPSGILLWNQRPRYHFQDHASSIRWNTKFANTQADDLAKLVPTITLNQRRYRADTLIWLYHKAFEYACLMPPPTTPPTIQHSKGLNDNRIETLSPGKTPRITYRHKDTNNIVYSLDHGLVDSTGEPINRYKVMATINDEPPYIFCYTHTRSKALNICRELNGIFHI